MFPHAFLALVLRKQILLGHLIKALELLRISFTLNQAVTELLLKRNRLFALADNLAFVVHSNSQMSLAILLRLHFCVRQFFLPLVFFLRFAWVFERVHQFRLFLDGLVFVDSGLDVGLMMLFRIEGHSSLEFFLFLRVLHALHFLHLDLDFLYQVGIQGLLLLKSEIPSDLADVYFFGR